MKKCPFCAEEIQEEAIKCRFCKEFLNTTQDNQLKWFFKPSIVILALLSAGPLALPLIWFHPHYKTASKIILTVLITAVSVYAVFMLWDLYLQVMNQLKALNL